MRTKASVMVVVAATMILGCDKPQKKALSNYWDLPDDAVVLTVNGHELTKGEQERILDLHEALVSIVNPKADAKMKRNMRMQMLRRCESVFVRNALLADWGRTNGVALADHERERARLDFARDISKGRLGYGEIAKRLPRALAEELDRYVDELSYNQKCVDQLAKKTAKPVTQDEVVKRRNYFTEYNKIVSATNAATWAAASNLWKRVQRNPAAFGDEIVKYQQQDVAHVSSDPDMGQVDLSFFEDDATWKDDLLKAKPGDVLRPRIGDNGLLMVKVLECIPPQRDQGPKWRLAKIFWELGEEWEPQTEAELREDIEKIHKRQAREQGYRALLTGVKVTYPSGTNLLQRTRTNAPQRGKRIPPNGVIPEEIRKRAIEKGADI